MDLRRLVHLDVRSNPLGDHGVLALCRAVSGHKASAKESQTQDKAELDTYSAHEPLSSGNQTTEAKTKHPQGTDWPFSIRDSQALQRLGLGETGLSDSGANTSLPYLCSHTTLTELDIGENLLTDNACGAVADVISSVDNLQLLTLRGWGPKVTPQLPQSAGLKGLSHQGKSLRRSWENCSFLERCSGFKKPPTTIRENPKNPKKNK
eukprot:5700214-Amphidinium_carterae.1